MILPKFKSIEIKHTTPSRLLTIEKLTTGFEIKDIITKKHEFKKLCEIGCINYGRKYSCPPHSPSFELISKQFKNINVIFYRILLDQYSDSTPYNRVRASNSVIKSLLDRELLSYKDKGYVVVGSGSCRACKPCGLKDNKKCKKPQKMIYSLESLGVDVNQLVKDCFGVQLEWYRKGQTQQYTAVVGGVLQ